MAVPIRSGATIEPGVPSPLFKLPIAEHRFNDVRNYYAVAGDGQRFLVMADEESTTRAISVILNWTSALNK